MGTSNSAEKALAVAGTKIDPGKWYGKLRCFQATITLASQIDGEIITLFDLPKGFRPLFGLLHSPTLGSSTIAIGIAGTTGKYRASAVHTAVVPTLFGAVGGMTAGALAADETVILTNTTAALPSSGQLTVMMFGTGQE